MALSQTIVPFLLVCIALAQLACAGDAFWEDVDARLLLPEPTDLRRDLSPHEHYHLPARPEEFRLVAHSADAIKDALRSATTRAGILSSYVDEEQDFPFSIPLPNGTNADVACFASDIIPQSLLDTMDYHFGAYVCSGDGVGGHFSLSDANGIRGLFTHHRDGDDVSFELRSVDPHDRIPAHHDLGSHQSLVYSFWSHKSGGERNSTEGNSHARGTCKTDHTSMGEEDVDDVSSRRGSLYDEEFTVESTELDQYVLLMGTTPQTFSNRFNSNESEAIEYFEEQLALINSVYNRELGVHWVMSASSTYAINSSAHASLPPAVDSSGDVLPMLNNIPSFLKRLKNVDGFNWEHHHAAIYVSSSGGGVVTDINAWCKYSGAVIGMMIYSQPAAEPAFNLAHELGHLLGMHHTFAGDDDCAPYVDYNGAVEPFSGNTLMAYPDFGRCKGGPTRAWQMDPSQFHRNYFHSVNHQQYRDALKVPNSYTSFRGLCYHQPFYSTFPFKSQYGKTLATSTPEISLNPTFTLPAKGKYYLSAEVKTDLLLGYSSASPSARFAWEQSDRLGSNDPRRGATYTADNKATVTSKRQSVYFGDLSPGIPSTTMTAKRFVPEISGWDTDVTAETEWARSPVVNGDVHFNFMLVGDEGYRSILRKGMTANVRSSLQPLEVLSAESVTAGGKHVTVRVDTGDSSDSRYDVYLMSIPTSGNPDRTEELIACGLFIIGGRTKDLSFCLPPSYDESIYEYYIRVVNSNAKEPYQDYTKILPSKTQGQGPWTCRYIGCGTRSDGKQVDYGSQIDYLEITNTFLSKLNSFRSSVIPAPRNMPELKWSDDLASEWDRNDGNRCNYQYHNPNATEDTSSRKWIVTGSSSDRLDFDFFFKGFFDELEAQKNAYNYWERSCFRRGECFDYPTLVQDRVTEVGFYVRNCSDAGGPGTPYTTPNGPGAYLIDTHSAENVYLVVITINWKEYSRGRLFDLGGLLQAKPPYVSRRRALGEESCNATCESFGIECGSFVNSCGEEIQCGNTCAEGSVCSADNKCIDCCADIGCGLQVLGNEYDLLSPCRDVNCPLCPDSNQECNIVTGQCEVSSKPQPTCESDLPSWAECGSIKGSSNETIPCWCDGDDSCHFGKCINECTGCEAPATCQKSVWSDSYVCLCLPPYEVDNGGNCVPPPSSLLSGGSGNGGITISYGGDQYACGAFCSRRSSTKTGESSPIIAPLDGTDELYDDQWMAIDSFIMIPEQNETAIAGIAMHIGDVHDGLPDHVSFAVRVSPIDRSATYHVQVARGGKLYDLTKHLEVENFERRGYLLPPARWEAETEYRLEMVSGKTAKGRRYVYLYVNGQPMGGLELPKGLDIPAGPSGAYVGSGRATWNEMEVKTYHAAELDFAECLTEEEIASVVADALGVVTVPEIIISGAYNLCDSNTRGDDESVRSSSSSHTTRQSATTPPALSGATVTIRSAAGIPSYALADRLIHLARTGGTPQLTSAGTTSAKSAAPTVPGAPALMGAAPASAVGLGAAAGLSAAAIAAIVVLTTGVAMLALGTLVVAGALGSATLLVPAGALGAVGAAVYARSKRAKESMEDDGGDDPEEPPRQHFPTDPYKPRGGVKLDDFDPNHRKSITGRVPTAYVGHQTTHVDQEPVLY